MNFSELIQTSMKKIEHKYKYELMRDSLGILFHNGLEDWLAVSNLNSTQINELEKILRIHQRFRRDLPQN